MTRIKRFICYTKVRMSRRQEVCVCELCVCMCVCVCRRASASALRSSALRIRLISEIDDGALDFGHGLYAVAHALRRQPTVLESLQVQALRTSGRRPNKALLRLY